MDLQDDWELLDDQGGHVLQLDHGGSGSLPDKNIRSGNHHHPPQCLLNNISSILHMNYFICPPPPPSSSSTPVEFVEKTRHQQLLPVPKIHPEPPATASDQPKARPQKTNTAAPVGTPEYIQSLHAYTVPDPVSHVFFEKMNKEISEFADIIKVESPSPRSNSASINVNAKEIITAPPEGAGGGSSHFHQFDAKGDPDCEIEDLDLELENREIVKLVEEAAEGGGGINDIFKWSLSGIGAICSFGVATVCVIVFSSHRKINKHTQRQNQIKLRFHTNYTKYHLRRRPEDEEARVVSWGHS